MHRRVAGSALEGQGQGWMKIITAGFMKGRMTSLLQHGFGNQEVWVLVSILLLPSCNIIDGFLRLCF